MNQRAWKGHETRRIYRDLVEQSVDERIHPLPSLVDGGALRSGPEKVTPRRRYDREQVMATHEEEERADEECGGGAAWSATRGDAAEDTRGARATRVRRGGGLVG